MRFIWLAMKLRSFARARWVIAYENEEQRMRVARVAPEKLDVPTSLPAHQTTGQAWGKQR